MNSKKNRKYTAILNIINAFVFVSLVVLILTSHTPFTPPPKTVIGACGGRDDCYPHTLCGCTGYNGCSGPSCSTCDPGSCGSCSPPGCPTNYTTTNTGCNTTTTSCTRTYCNGDRCGSSTRTCYLVRYTLTYTAGAGGTLSGTTSQSVCRGSSGTAVTANANTGYAFSSWSDGITSNPRTDTNVTANKSVTANFIQTNLPPTAPTNLTTEEAVNPVGVTDTTPEFRARFQDPDSGNTAIYYQIQVNTNSSFTGTVMWDSGKTTLSPALAIGADMPDESYAGTALTLNGTTYYWRIKFWDNLNTEGAWSATANFTMNTAPSAPTSLLTEGATNPVGVTDTTPEFSALFQDPNSGNTGAYYEINVNTDSSFGGTVMWSSGQVAMTSTAIGARSPDISYAGTALTLNGTTYYWRIRFTDNYGTVGAWSATANFTMNTAPSSPTSLLTEGATNPIGVTDTTPEFSAVFQDPNSGNTATHYEIHVNTNSSFTGTVMWNSGQVSMTPISIGARSPDISYAGTTLTLNGVTYYWRIRFTDNYGTVGAWSSTANFTMNTAPSAPTDLHTEGSTNPPNVTDTTPEFSAIFYDADSGSAGLYYQIHVNTNSSFTGTVMWDSGKISTAPMDSGGRSPNISYAGTTLTLNGTRYYWRIKFWDNLDSESSWSATANFTMQGQPSAPTDLHTDGVSNPPYILSLTPSFTAIYNDPNMHNATAYEIHVNTNSSFTGTVMWNTGKVSTTVSPGARSPEYTYGGTPLETDDTTYYWRVRFWDSDDLQGDWSATSTFVSRLNRQYFKGIQMKGVQLR